MVTARLTGSHSYRARVYKEDGKWYVFRTWNGEVWRYDNWYNAFNNAFLNVTLTRKYMR